MCEAIGCQDAQHQRLGREKRARINGNRGEREHSYIRAHECTDEACYRHKKSRAARKMTVYLNLDREDERHYKHPLLARQFCRNRDLCHHHREAGYNPRAEEIYLQELHLAVARRVPEGPDYPTFDIIMAAHGRASGNDWAEREDRDILYEAYEDATLRERHALRRWADEVTALRVTTRTYARVLQVLADEYTNLQDHPEDWIQFNKEWKKSESYLTSLAISQRLGISKKEPSHPDHGDLHWHECEN